MVSSPWDLQFHTMSAPAHSPIDEQVVYDERGLVPCVVQDWRTGEVLMLAYMNAEALAAHARDGRAAPVQPLARAGVAQGRNQRQRPGGPRAAAGLRRRHAAGARGARRARLPHGRAHVLSSRRARAGRAARGPARAGADAARARARASRGLLHRHAARRSRARRREGAEEAEEVTRAAREESDERVDEEAADLLYHLLVLVHGRGRDLADAERVLDGRRR